jgi:uncharacterized NAD-dependent epimerase/dehydratase family protein
MERRCRMLKRDVPLALYMEGAVGEISGKMGYGVLRYSPNPVACIVDSLTAGGDIQKLVGSPRACPIVATVAEAAALGARALVLGIAPPGGAIPAEWFGALDDSVARGMSLVNGLHERLSLRYPNLKPGQAIYDVRVEPPGLEIGMGRPRFLANRRLLMIGTDMAIGKMTAGLEILRVAQARGVRAEFVATGQIGIVVSGRGVPLDAIRLDFASGAIEREVLAVRDADLIVIEGQGSLIHPASSANLPLLRGSCPTHLVLCHRAGQETLRRIPEISIPPLKGYIRLYEDVAEACGTFARPKTVAVALNTAHMDCDDSARLACEVVSDETGLPCTDPVRFGAGALVDALV